MSKIITVGLDLAKIVFQVHVADAAGGAVLRKKRKPWIQKGSPPTLTFLDKDIAQIEILNPPFTVAMSDNFQWAVWRGRVASACLWTQNRPGPVGMGGFAVSEARFETR